MTKRFLFPTDQQERPDSPGKAAPGPNGPTPSGTPALRFEAEERIVRDLLTGLVWTRDAAESMFPVKWGDALDLVARMNRMRAYGFSDWRLPNRRELFSLVSHTRCNPALPAGHPFTGVSLGAYWTSTSVARLSAEAWKVNMGIGKVGVSPKHTAAMIWPVRGGQGGQISLAWTGQKLCYTLAGNMARCKNCGQDGELRVGAPWPSPRFTQSGAVVLDLLTGLEWTADADCGKGLTTWDNAFTVVAGLNAQALGGRTDWRVPTIRELESITDMGAHFPAIAKPHPSGNVREWYWSSTTCAHEPSLAWRLETTDGKIGGRPKNESCCYVWAVRF